MSHKHGRRQGAGGAGPDVTPRQLGAAPLEIYDTTLRDGAQAEDVSFSADDKVLVAKKLDELGVHYIEGGWPGANPKDIEFFRIIKTVPLKHAAVVAFGSTRKADNPVQTDPNIRAATPECNRIPTPTRDTFAMASVTATDFASISFATRWTRLTALGRSARGTVKEISVSEAWLTF